MGNRINFNQTNIYSAAEIMSAALDIRENGLPTGHTTGINNIDNLFRFDLAKLAIITGIPTHGKSEFVDFICMQMNKLHGFKTLYFSPENDLKNHLIKLLCKASNKKFTNLSDDELVNYTTYISNNFFFIDSDKVDNLDDVLKEAALQIQANSIKLLVLDPWNCIEGNKPTYMIETEHISNVLTRLQRFAKKHNILIMLVAHPTKMKADDNDVFKIPNAYDIAGSANFFNKSDYVLTVHRFIKEDYTLIKVNKVKFKNLGQTGEICLNYDIISGNYYDCGDVNDNLGVNDAKRIKEVYTPVEFTPPVTPVNNLLDVLDIEIDAYSNITDNICKKANLKELLTTNKFKERIEQLRSIEDKEEQKEFKKTLPNFTLSAVFNGTRNNKNVIKYTNLICVDIDKQDNTQDMNTIGETLKRIDNIAYYARSCRGNGYFAIIPIAHGERLKDHFKALQEDFLNLGIVLDKSCSDVTRVRYVTFDNNYYINPNPVIYTRMITETTSKSKQNNTSKTSNKPLRDTVIDVNSNNIKISESDLKSLETTVNHCDNYNTNILEDRENWFQVGTALANELGEQGRDYFHRLSNKSKKYDEQECNDKYDEMITNRGTYNYNIGTIFHIFNNRDKGGN
ncbi:MAG: BT4734/BF3469 family protein [Parabacteroides sp.]|nr:BT4734/BF3469 family protein [Parabacteroides sp.]